MHGALSFCCPVQNEPPGQRAPAATPVPVDVAASSSSHRILSTYMCGILASAGRCAHHDHHNHGAGQTRRADGTGDLSHLRDKSSQRTLRREPAPQCLPGSRIQAGTRSQPEMRCPHRNMSQPRRCRAGHLRCLPRRNVLRCKPLLGECLMRAGSRSQPGMRYGQRCISLPPEAFARLHNTVLGKSVCVANKWQDRTFSHASHPNRTVRTDISPRKSTEPCRPSQLTNSSRPGRLAPLVR